MLATVSGTSWSTPALDAPSDWRFGVRAFDTVSGLEEQNVDAAVEIVVSAGGTDVSNVPQPVSLATATALAGTAAAVHWFYPVAAARAVWRPTGFQVFIGTPTVSYTAPAATVAYTGNTTTFSAALSGLTAGDTYQVVVRAYNAVGDDGNTTVVSLTIPAGGPDPVVDLTAVATATA